jgi:hypothetical protein
MTYVLILLFVTIGPAAPVAPVTLPGYESLEDCQEAGRSVWTQLDKDRISPTWDAFIWTPDMVVRLLCVPGGK